LLIFIGVAEAYAVLKDEDLRKTYDANKKVEIPDIDPMEMFHENAYGDEVHEWPEPSPVCQEIYKEATSWVLELLSDPEEDVFFNSKTYKNYLKENADKFKIDRKVLETNPPRIGKGAAQQALEKLNARIREDNKKNRPSMDKNINTIQISQLVGLATTIKLSYAKARETQTLEAQELYREALETQRDWIDDYHYPRTWKVPKQKATPKAAQSGQPSGRTGDPLSSSNGPGGHGFGSSSGFAREPGSSSGAAEFQRRPAGSQKNPGFTQHGDRILSYSPKEGIDLMGDGRKALLDATFAVQKLGQPNPMVLQSWGEVGTEAGKAYHLWQNHKIYKGVQNRYSRADGHRVVSIEAVHCPEPNPHLATFRYPPRLAHVKFADDEDVLNATALRNALGKNNADRRLEKFFIDRNLAVPWAEAQAYYRSKELGLPETLGSTAKRLQGTLPQSYSNVPAGLTWPPKSSAAAPWRQPEQASTIPPWRHQDQYSTVPPWRQQEQAPVAPLAPMFNQGPPSPILESVQPKQLNAEERLRKLEEIIKLFQMA
jgi:hypothetical protein